jgi:hypothetical protein
VTAATNDQIQREQKIMDAYQDFRGALKQSEVLALEVLKTAQGRLDQAKSALDEAMKLVEANTSQEPAERARLELARDEKVRDLQQEEKRYQIAKDLSDNLTVSYNTSEVVMARLHQTTNAKERVYAQAVSFFSTNEVVLTALTASFTGMFGLHEGTQTVEAMKEGVSQSLGSACGYRRQGPGGGGQGRVWPDDTRRVGQEARGVGRELADQIPRDHRGDARAEHTERRGDPRRGGGGQAEACAARGGRQGSGAQGPVMSMGSATRTEAPPAGGAEIQAVAGSVHPLDDVMLAMDVVDTLRRRERIVKNELDDLGREEDLAERLRKIYAAQGIEVPDHVIEQGVAALKEGRFTYQPPPRSIATRLARIYVDRGRWGKRVGAVAGALVLAGGIHYFAFVAPTAALPKQLVGVHTEAIALAKTDQARETLVRYLNAGQAAVRDGDTEGARKALSQLESARTLLGQEYVLRIANRPRRAERRLAHPRCEHRRTQLLHHGGGGGSNGAGAQVADPERGDPHHRDCRHLGTAGGRGHLSGGRRRQKGRRHHPA